MVTKLVAEELRDNDMVPGRGNEFFSSPKRED